MFFSRRGRGGAENAERRVREGNEKKAGDREVTVAVSGL